MDNSKAKIPSYLTVGKVITYAMYVWIMFGIIMLGLRVFLLAFSANPTTPFVEFVYNTSASFLQPFRGIFPPRSLSETGYLDVAALFAMIIYGLIGWGFTGLISYIQTKINAFSQEAEKQRNYSLQDTATVSKTTSQARRKI